jgi:hypothetical protein
MMADNNGAMVQSLIDETLAMLPDPRNNRHNPLDRHSSMCHRISSTRVPIDKTVNPRPDTAALKATMHPAHELDQELDPGSSGGVLNRRFPAAPAEQTVTSHGTSRTVVAVQDNNYGRLSPRGDDYYRQEATAPFKTQDSARVQDPRRDIRPARESIGVKLEPSFGGRADGSMPIQIVADWRRVDTQKRNYSEDSKPFVSHTTKSETRMSHHTPNLPRGTELAPVVPSFAQQLSLECQSRRFNPRFIETTHPNGFTCGVHLNRQFLPPKAVYDTAGAAKQAAAKAGLSVVMKMPYAQPSPLSLANGTDHNELNSALKRIEALVGNSPPADSMYISQSSLTCYHLETTSPQNPSACQLGGL